EEDRPRRQLRLLLDHLREAAEHPGADVPEVGRAGGEERIVEPGERLRLLLDRLLPGPAGALAGSDPALGAVDEIGIGEELGVSEEDGGAGLSRLRPDVLVELPERRPGGRGRLAEPTALPLGVLGGTLDDDLALPQEAQGTDRQARRRGEPGHGRADRAGLPSMGGAGEEDLLFLDLLDLPPEGGEGGL